MGGGGGGGVSRPEKSVEKLEFGGFRDISLCIRMIFVIDDCYSCIFRYLRPSRVRAGHWQLIPGGDGACAYRTLHAAPFRTSGQPGATLHCFLGTSHVGMEGCRTTRASSRSRVGSEAAGTRTASTSSDGSGRNTANSVGTADCPSPSNAAFDDPPSDDPHNQGSGGADSDDDR